MKYLLLILAFFLPTTLFAITGQDSKFDFSQGKPEIAADATDDCNDTARARFDFTVGQPDVVLDATANCTSVVVAGGIKDEGIIWFDSD